MKGHPTHGVISGCPVRLNSEDRKDRPTFILLRTSTISTLTRRGHSIKSLDIEQYADTAILTQLASAFPSLERLFIRLDPFSWRQADLYAHHPNSISAIKAFLPLKYLCLRGLRTISVVLDILGYHGQTLRGLSLGTTFWARSLGNGRDTGHKYPEFTAEDIPRLATFCPGLKELRLQIKRSQGSAEECAIYRSIGAFFPNLQSLILDLHFDPRSRPIQTPAHDSAEIDIDILRAAFVNAAMDESLARCIWDLIYYNQPSQSLRNLRLIPYGTHYFPYKSAHLLGKFAKSFHRG